MNNYTTKEQGKHLLELRLSPKTADMEYMFHKDSGESIVNYPFVKDNDTNYDEDRVYDYIPCWSLSALLEITKCCNRLEIHLREDKTWNIFATINNSIFRSFDKLQGKGYKTQFDALYDVVCWLLENKLV